ncbi:RRN11 [Candida margitis]|uniref:RRN11 n=1 Tax=Candida margitis TaxID=1775924 RepID=UPI002226ABB4|nr:RRN11 [Candida margitis]KAI5969607.1 RRN11 [Candida margitis]
MIFEDITDTDHKLRRTKRNKTQLISKYVELKRLDSIYQQSTSVRKRKLRHPEVKRYVLKLIHEEMKQRMKPEETFEVWHKFIRGEERKSKQKGRKKTKPAVAGYDQLQFGNDTLVSKVYEFLDMMVPDSTIENESDLDLQMDGIDDGDDDDDYDEYDIVSTTKLDQITKEFDIQNTSTKTQFIIESSGMEVMPSQSVSTSQSIINKHVNNLNSLLHANILRQNWELSYKLFCIIVRFPMVDIRQLWPLGIEILTQLATMKNPLPATVKITKFFNYLNSFFTIGYRNTISIERSDRSSIAPAWRSGTRSLTPLYLITSLWHLFVHQEYEQTLNKILELILEPPYHKEGVLFFIVALCYLCQCCSIVNHFALQPDLERFNETGATYRSPKECLNLLNVNWSKIELNVNKCKEFDFEVPVTELKSQWDSIMDKFYEIRKSTEKGKPEANTTTVADSIAETGEEDDSIQIESDNEILPPLDTSTQNKGLKNLDYDFENVETTLDNNDNDDMEDDWSQIQSDSDGEVYPKEELRDTVIDGDEWGAIGSNSEEETPEAPSGVYTENGKALYNETPTQHDSALLSNEDTRRIQPGNEVKNINTEAPNVEEDDDWDDIESDHEEIDMRNLHDNGSVERDVDEHLDGREGSVQSIDERNRVIDSIKQVDDSSIVTEEGEDQENYKWRRSQSDGFETNSNSGALDLGQKPSHRNEVEIDFLLDNHTLHGSRRKPISREIDFELEWSSMEDNDGLMKSNPTSPIKDRVERTTPDGEKRTSNAFPESSVQDGQSRADNDWEMEWSQIDDDVLSSEDDHMTTIMEVNGDDAKQEAEEARSSSLRYVPSFDSQPISSSYSNDNALSADISSLSTTSQTTADESIEDSPFSSFDYRRNSFELHQKRLESDTTSNLRKKSKSSKERRKSKNRRHEKVKKPSHHTLEKHKNKKP